MNKSIDSEVTLNVSAARVVPKQNSLKANFASFSVVYLKIFDPRQRLAFKISDSSTFASGSDSADPKNNTVSASYSKRFESSRLSSSANVTQRNAKQAYSSGQNRTLSLGVDYPIAEKTLYTNFSLKTAKDEAAVPTQSAAREATVRTYEIGYSLPVPVTDQAKLTFYVLKSETNSNLALYKTKATTFGMKFKTYF